MNDQRKISQSSPLNLAAIVTKQGERQQLAFSGLF